MSIRRPLIATVTVVALIVVALILQGLTGSRVAGGVAAVLCVLGFLSSIWWVVRGRRLARRLARGSGAQVRGR